VSESQAITKVVVELISTDGQDLVVRIRQQGADGEDARNPVTTAASIGGTLTIYVDAKTQDGSLRLEEDVVQ
jgi:hypothetical protein